jgi:hypothetical protein
MHLLISILAALLGSLLGSAARGVVATAQLRTVGGTEAEAETVVNVTISPVAGLVGGVAGSLLGAGNAFWIGAVLGAAGMDRLDARLLGQVGIDMDAMVAKAMEAAAKARSGGEAEEDAAPSGAAGEADSAETA